MALQRFLQISFHYTQWYTLFEHEQIGFGKKLDTFIYWEILVFM